MKYFKTRIFFTMAFMCAGCANQSVLTRCPDYFRQNIGEIKTTINPLYLGYVSPKDTNGTIYLSPLAGNKTLLHEAFHSFEIRCGHQRYEEWLRFYNAYGEGNYNKMWIFADYLIFPMGFSRWSCHFENSAGIFVDYMSGKNNMESRKKDAIRNFIEGNLR